MHSHCCIDSIVAVPSRQTTLAVTLRDLLDFYGLCAAHNAVREKETDAALAGLRALQPFVQVCRPATCRTRLLIRVHSVEQLSWGTIPVGYDHIRCSCLGAFSCSMWYVLPGVSGILTCARRKHLHDTRGWSCGITYSGPGSLAPVHWPRYMHSQLHAQPTALAGTRQQNATAEPRPAADLERPACSSRSG